MPPDYLLKDHDFIAHTIHRHEPPVLNIQISAIAEDDQVALVLSYTGFNTMLYNLQNIYLHYYTTEHWGGGILENLRGPTTPTPFSVVY